MTFDFVKEATLKYFNGDTLLSDIFLNKYILYDSKTNEYKEKDPNDMFVRIAKELARIEQKYPNPISYNAILSLIKDFTYIIPGGSSLYGIGNDYSYSSLGNCFVIGTDTDSYGGIFRNDEEMAQLMKRRGGVGFDISTLRPNGSVVSNSAKYSTGAVSFMERYSNTTREVAQDGRRGALMLTIDCFSKNTNILTNIGWINIVDLIDKLNNDEIIYAIDKYGNECLIKNPIVKEPSQIYEIEAEDGTKIEVTADHKFEVKNIYTNKIYLKKINEIDIDIEELILIAEDVE